MTSALICAASLAALIFYAAKIIRTTTRGRKDRRTRSNHP